MNNTNTLQDNLEKVSLGEMWGPGGLPDESLRPILEIAETVIGAAEGFNPSPNFMRLSRRRVQSQVGFNRRRNPWKSWRWSAICWWQSPRLHVCMAVLLAAVFYFNVAATIQASQGWLPGDWLYPLKPATEDLRLLASFSTAQDAELHIEFAHRRLMEMQGLVFENRYAHIPATVANFDRHVSQAVRLVNRLAGDQENKAAVLAEALDRCLSNQIGMVVLLAELTPETSQPQFERMLLISNDGLTGVQNVLAPDAGEMLPYPVAFETFAGALPGQCHSESGQ